MKEENSLQKRKKKYKIILNSLQRIIILFTFSLFCKGILGLSSFHHLDLLLALLSFILL